MRFRCKARGTPGASSQGLAYGLLGLAVASVAGHGCNGKSAPPPRRAPLEVEYAGCRAVLSGPICLVAVGDTLELWVRLRETAAVEILGGAEVGPPVEVRGGRRYEARIGEGTSEIIVRQADGGGESEWRLELRPEEPRPWLEEARRRTRSEDLEGAEALLRSKVGSPSAVERGLARSRLARIAWRRGEAEGAMELLRRAIEDHRRSGRRSDRLDDATMLAFLLLEQRRLGETRELLDELAQVEEPSARGLYYLSYYRGLLGAGAGDLRGTLRPLRTAAAVAERFGWERERAYAETMLARELQRVGRGAEADEIFSRVLAQRDVLGDCERAEVLTNSAWRSLMAAEAGERSVDPRPPLGEALELNTESCPGAGPRRAHILVNLALAELQRGRLGPARLRLEEASSQPARPPEVLLWAWDIEGRLELARGRRRSALEAYRRLATAARETRSPEALWRSEVGRARALEDLGETRAALEAYAEAEALLDRQALLVPMHWGRGSFVTQRQGATLRYLDRLLQEGEVETALAVSRRSRSRLLRSFRGSARVASLPADEHSGWYRAIEGYLSQRAEVDELAATYWRLSGEEHRRALNAAVERLAELQDGIDELFAGLVGGAAEALPEPGAGEVFLVYHPLPEGWMALAADGEEVAARRVQLPAEVLEDPEEVSRRLLEPFAETIRRARRLRVLAHGSLDSIDFHALPFAGGPLLAAGPVAYGLDLPESSVPAPGSRRGALVVADPTGDLPWALREARAVEAALGRRFPGGVEVLRGAGATGPELRRHLGHFRWLHYAGHALSAGWRSRMPLADGGQLTVTDILALPRAPENVVLSGCETGLLSAAEGIGLAHAFLAAGARSVVAAVRPLPDRSGAQLMASFYGSLNDGASTEEALRRAQLELREAGEASWSALRLYLP